MCGVDRSVVRRAEYVAEACRSHQLNVLRREIAQTQQAHGEDPAATGEDEDMQRKEAIVRRFVGIQLPSVQTGDPDAIKEILKDIFATSSDEPIKTE